MSEEKKFERGQVWVNPEDQIMMIIGVRQCGNHSKIFYVTEDKELGHFYSNSEYIRDSISLFPASDEPSCETCKGDPVECANVPSLRHCEAATREPSDLASGDFVPLEFTTGIYEEFFKEAINKGYKHPVIPSEFNLVVQFLHKKGHLKAQESSE